MCPTFINRFVDYGGISERNSFFGVHGQIDRPLECKNYSPDRIITLDYQRAGSHVLAHISDSLFREGANGSWRYVDICFN